MNPHEIEAVVDQRLRVLNVICAALVFSVMVYVAIAWFLVQRGSVQPSEGLPQVFPVILVLVALSVVMAAPVVSTMILKQGVAAAGEDAGRRLNSHQTSLIVGFALREVAAVMGLVLTLLSGRLIWVVALAAVAVAAMLLAWPKREKMLELARGGPGSIG